MVIVVVVFGAFNHTHWTHQICGLMVGARRRQRRVVVIVYCWLLDVVGLVDIGGRVSAARRRGRTRGQRRVVGTWL